MSPTSITQFSSSEVAALAALDAALSRRTLRLDPAGYFIIYVDREQRDLGAKFFPVVVNEQGLAIDPATGKPLSAKGKVTQPPSHCFRGRTAKELAIAIFEAPDSPLANGSITLQNSHAAYVGRELQKAEQALCQGSEYIQD